jgi:hypothetical protein
MKNILKSTATLALLFLATLAMANDPKISLTSVGDSKTLILKMDSDIRESKIKIHDSKGHTIFTESTKGVAYARTFNLNQLSVGTYSFTVENAKSSIDYTLDVSTNDVKIKNEKLSTPRQIFRQVDNMVSINFINTERHPVRIQIFDSRNNLVLNELLKGEFLVGKLFNFEKAIKGTYYMVVNDGDLSYYNSVIIR